MENDDVNIYNLYEQVTYTHDDIDKCLIISWDDRNPIIKKLMLNEAFFFNSTKQSLSSHYWVCLLYTSPSPRDRTRSRMPSSA